MFLISRVRKAKEPGTLSWGVAEMIQSMKKIFFQDLWPRIF